MSKHTPGPWEWNTARTRMNDDRGRPVLMDGEGIWDLCAPVMHGDARADANARLIAAAPELLAALQKAVADCKPTAVHGTELVYPDWYYKAYEAIAKAGV